METIKVNMTPCEDIKTIHASQNDNEAREWGFELHNNGEKIDSSSISDQLVFKAYKGGTEQILPTNGSTPTTSPFLGDIRYPQGLLSDQEFLYRESPTEEDGLAKITDIKGNTLAWNQLFEPMNNGSFTTNGVTVTHQDGKYTLSGTATDNGGRTRRWNNSNISLKANHKYLLLSPVNLSISNASTHDYEGQFNTGVIRSFSSDVDVYFGLNVVSGTTYNQSGYVNFFDLTAMGLESLTVDEFTSLFPLPYYSYNQGTLLSFNGNGIKTVGFNQWDEQTQKGYWNGSNGNFVSNQSQLCSLNYISVFPNTDYCYCKSLNLGDVIFYDANKVFISSIVNIRANTVFTTPSNCHFININLGSTYGATYNNDICINISDTELNGTYEPYTSHTTNLPISTYFPTGMKSAGNVYDEWTPNKASPRVGTVTLNGTEDWRMPDSSGNCWMNFDNMPVVADYTKTMTATVTVAKSRTSMVANSITGYNSGTTNYLYFRTADATQTNDNVKAYLQANPVTLNYELKESTETSFTTASLVTENAEIPLSNDDGTLIGKCTEQLSAEPGFHDAKIKLTDSDGDVYSNKIQLHVERSPQ